MKIHKDASEAKAMSSVCDPRQDEKQVGIKIIDIA